jgi:hypothetical protein
MASASVLVLANAQATTRYVSPSGNNTNPYTNWTMAARSIQPAIDACANGDEVVVAPATYAITNTIQLNKQITVRSSAGASSTILDGGYPSRSILGVQITTLPAYLDGFTLTHFANGVFVNHGEGTEGQPRDCLIVYNQGYGIYFNHGGGAKNCTVAYNGGAGLYAYDMGGGGDDPDNMILWANAGGNFVRNSANIGLQTSWTNDPHFVSTNDFHLLPDSPCIDTGHNETWMNTAIDADGRPRVGNGTVDMGAYENGLEISIAVSALDIQWSSRTNRHYQVQYTTNLLTPAWTNLGSLYLGTGSGMYHMDIIRGLPNRFYRVVENP